jgi:hypothetical protein
MKETPQRPSQGPSFAVIYLLITAAIAAAIFTLKPAPEEVSLTLPDEERIIKKDAPAKPSPVPKRDRDPNPPLPKPTPSLQSPPKPDSKTSAKSNPKANTSKQPTQEVAKTNGKPGADPSSKPPAPALTPEQEKEIEELYPFPQVRPLMEIVDNWRNIPDKAFPKLVAIRKPISFDMSQGGATVARGKLPAGSMMVPVRLMGDQLMVKTAGSAPITVTIPVADTDFRESIQNRYDRYVEQTRSAVLAQREAERNRRLGAARHEVEITGWNDGADSRFDPAKLSLQKGEVGTFSLLDAAKWRWGGIEISEGVEYETAFVLIVTEAAFGVTEKELKVYLKDGKAVRWIDPATGAAL